MGQAFNKYGDLLGEAFGATKREVFEKLDRAHADAAEIRIKTLAQRLTENNGGASVEMPRYKCHKVVHALKIADIFDPTEPGNESDGSMILRWSDPGYGQMAVSHDYVRKHKPVVGGYYVVYDDGYASFSPAKAFEEGYTRI